MVDTPSFWLEIYSNYLPFVIHVCTKMMDLLPLWYIIPYHFLWFFMKIIVVQVKKKKSKIPTNYSMFQKRKFTTRGLKWSENSSKFTMMPQTQYGMILPICFRTTKLLLDSTWRNWRILELQFLASMPLITAA